jgi:protease-4
MTISNRTKKILKVGYVVTVLVTVLAFWMLSLVVYLTSNAEEDCTGSNVGIVRIHEYMILPEEYEEGGFSADKIVRQIQEYSNNTDIKVIIVDINSTGGSMAAADQIAEALQKTEKKTVAVIRDHGQSAAYLIASATDKIYASKYSLTGNIGINKSILSRVEENKKQNLEYIDLSSAPFKDLLNPDRPLSELDQIKIRAITGALHEKFVTAVADNRHMDKAKVAMLADGMSYTADEALKNGLVDKIGDKETIYTELAAEGIVIRACSGG